MTDITILNNLFKYSTATISNENFSKKFLMKQKNSFKIIWVKVGNLEIVLSNKKMILTENDCILINKKSELIINCEGKVNFTYFQFSDAFFNVNPEIRTIKDDTDLFNDKNIYKIIQLNENYVNTVNHYINVLNRMSNRKKNTLNKLLVQNTIHQIILLTVSIYDNFNNKFEFKIDEDESIIENLNILISENIENQRILKFYAQEMKTSIDSLNKICEIHYNKTLKQHIDDCCIIRIKCKLEISTLSIKEISYKYNFSDVSNFCRFFKRKTKMTPIEYRNSLQQ